MSMNLKQVFKDGYYMYYFFIWQFVFLIHSSKR
jgi:hypothetical protein